MATSNGLSNSHGSNSSSKPFWNRTSKICLAERAIASRLRDPKPFEPDERIALGEALLALRSLLCDLTDQDLKKESSDAEDIA